VKAFIAEIHGGAAHEPADASKDAHHSVPTRHLHGAALETIRAQTPLVANARAAQRAALGKVTIS
jgi:hypothetical protein